MKGHLQIFFSFLFMAQFFKFHGCGVPARPKKKLLICCRGHSGYHFCPWKYEAPRPPLAVAAAQKKLLICCRGHSGDHFCPWKYEAPRPPLAVAAAQKKTFDMLKRTFRGSFLPME